MKRPLIYLDYAAATPVSPEVRAAMEPYWSGQFYNPSATYLPAVKVRHDLEVARHDVAQVLGCRASEIIFTAGGSEANNLAIDGVMRGNPNGNVVVSAIEHESVLRPAEDYSCRVAPVGPDGVVDVSALEKLIDNQTLLVSVMYANNEVGTIQPIREIAAMIRAKRLQRKSQLPLYLHTDAAQAANYLDLHVARLGVDLMTLNGGKIYGPKQSGGLYVRAGVRLAPLIRGGGQEQNLRSGTENVPACIGFAAALKAASALRSDETRRLHDLQKQFIDSVLRQVPGAELNGSKSRRLPNNVHLTIAGSDNERLLLQLEADGILAAAGSACSASNDQPSHVLSAMGRTEEAARSSLRFSLGRATTSHDVAAVVDSLVRLLA